MNTELPFESYVTSVVRPLRMTTREEREELIREAHYNLFQLPAEAVTFDLLTDSGTGAISNQQLAAIMTGDESYAGSQSFREMQQVIQDLTGLTHVLPTHQGRAAENVLFSTVLKEGDVIPGNTHFDTTKGHIEFRKAHAVDCTIAAARDAASAHPFKGNVDIERLEQVINEVGVERIPLCIVTVTCNSGGGQPVSLANLHAVKDVCARYDIPVYLDMARFAENAYFIKTRESEYADWSIRDICREMFRDVAGATMSAKKDAITAMGGFLALQDATLFEQCSVHSILCEGYLTYGGMTGGTMAALAQGLREATEFEYLHTRITQVARLGQLLAQAGVPIVQPTGGHAIYIDAAQFLPHIPREQFPAQALAVAAYIEGGVRGVEIGTVMADRDPETGENRFPELELVRLAIPRRTYSDRHLEYVADVFARLLKQRDQVHGLAITREAPVLRHFTCQFRTV